jgi:hypothetical protein
MYIATWAAAIGALLLGTPLFAQKAGWDELSRIAPGQPVTIMTRDHEVVDGRFRTWSPSGIEITRGKQMRAFDIVDIDRLQVHEKASRLKAAMWGALIGFGIVFPFGAASAGYLTDQNDPSLQTRAGMGAGLGLFGAGIGAAVGALAGGSRPVTVYRAQRRP